MNIDFAFIIGERSIYPVAPFDPDQDYPEFGGIFTRFNDHNFVYAAIRKLFLESGYDKKNARTSNWNPFRGYIKQGGIVVIKPNLVLQESGRLLGTHCLMTHASVIRPVIDYLHLLQVTDKIDFRIVIGDVPIQGANFNEILKQTGLKTLQEFYSIEFGLNLEILDLRHKIVTIDNSGFYIPLPAEGDKLGYTKIHIENSFLQEIVVDYKKFGAPGYGLNETNSQIESSGLHYYHIANTILAADLFINIPKLKTHKKAGITAAMKNLIGINGEKAWIPHFRRGSIRNGGDEFDDKQVLLKTITSKAYVILRNRSRLLWKIAKRINDTIIKYFRKDLRKSSNLTDYERKALFLLDGNWYGNDTLWRPILDLNYLLYVFDKNGIKSKVKARNYICITDGIIAGEGDGPLDPLPKNAGILALSENPVINDICLSRIMGFDWEKIPQLKNSVRLKKIFSFNGDPDSIKIIQSDDSTEHKMIDFNRLPALDFIPPPGWLGHIEK